MPDEQQTINVVARERADKRIDQAVGELHRAATEIGKKHGIPEGIHGLSVDELIGRMSYIPTMARDLRTACGQELAKQEINTMFDEKGTPGVNAIASPSPTAAETGPKITGTIPAGMDIGALDGVSPQTIKALRDAGLTTVGEIVDIPDEHLCKMQGLGEKSVAHVRLAIAKAAS